MYLYCVFYDVLYCTVSIIHNTVTTPLHVSSTVLSSLPDGACTFVKLYALKPGHTKLTVSYTHGSTHLETFITIASYPPLRPIDPEAVAVVTLGASKTVVFEGGPAAWVLDPSRYKDSCKINNTDH